MLQPAALAFRAQSPLPPRVRGRSAAGRRFLLRGRGHMSFQRHRKIYPDVETLLALGWLPSQRLIGMSFQLTIPRRVALQHCSLPLRQPRSFLNKIVPFVDIISASGYLSPFSLYQLRGPLHSIKPGGKTGTGYEKANSERERACGSVTQAAWGDEHV